MEKKKYLIASGCSFTQGHILGESASWATYMPYEIINLGVLFLFRYFVLGTSCDY